MDSNAINFNVLQRHDPHITSILDFTSYAVVYRYFHGAWSKTGIEGTMFIFQRDTAPLYGVFVLNRQGLNNLCQGLTPGWEVDLDDGLIIWRNAGATGDADDDEIHGLWVYEASDRNRLTETMQNLLLSSSPQPESEAAPTPLQVSLSHPVPRVPIIPAGQSISLDQLFGVGSVCSEHLPQTSAVAYPGTSVADPQDNQGFLPQHVMSPDPSDLPKGMQLLDSLFQRASIKTQPSNQPPPPEPAPQPLSINQLLHHQEPPTQRAALENSTSASSSHKHPSHTRERRDSSTDENYKPQSFIEGAPTQPHRGHPQQNSREPNPSAGPQPGSRRSSGGSSSHMRSEKPNGHPVPQYHPHQQPQPVMVPAPIPIDSANAEARHNILSLLNHPAAAAAVPVHPSAPGHVSNPASRHSGSWTGPNGSPDSGHSGGYHRSSYGRNAGGAGGAGSDRVYTGARSHQGSQQQSPHQISQDAHQLHRQTAAHPHQSSPGGSPRAPHHHHRATPPKLPLPPVPRQQSGPSSSGYNGPHAWTSNRALSPLNPAHVHHLPNQAPRVNDSSRPSRTNSLKTKLAAEVLDETVAGTESQRRDDEEALDKKEFVVAINELLKNNGAFVDTLYARYLARYAEKFL